jgi:hypothetical protein
MQKDLAGYWKLCYPEIVNESFEDFYQALDIMDFKPKRAEKIFRKIIAVCGNGHIDAILHLGFLYNDIGKNIEGNALVNKAHAIALDSIPTEFNEEKRQYTLAGSRKSPAPENLSCHWFRIDEGRPVRKSHKQV